MIQTKGSSPFHPYQLVMGGFDFLRSQIILTPLNTLRQWATLVKRDVFAVYLASRDPRVPWYAKLVAALVAAYAFSPVDLIPDFIPVIGFLDDLILLPIGIMLVIHLVGPELMVEFRAAAEKHAGLPKNWVMAVVIIILWMVGMTLLGLLFIQGMAEKEIS